MTPYYSDDSVRLLHGDCLDVLREMPDASVDSVVTDPPYALEFMGKQWDGWATPKAFQSWCTEWAVECLRVLKPGGHMLAFGGSRTWHRLASGIEDARFEIRDSIAWLYGSGFPKSLDVSKAIDKAAGAEREVIGKTNRCIGPSQSGQDGIGTFKETNWETSNLLTAPATDAAKQWEGWGTALKPAFEPIVVARKPLVGTVAQNVTQHGTGALNIAGCRTATSEPLHGSTAPNDIRGGHYGSGHRAGDIAVYQQNAAGRWPTNVVLDEHAAAELDRQSGTSVSRSGGRRGTNVLGVMNDDGWVPKDGPRGGHDDSGGASRFFPVFKYTAKADSAERPEVDGVRHPTVKPLSLMRWLVRLVTPPGGLVLDPFAGSGTTGEAAVLEHMRAILVEREPDYLPLIVARLTKPIAVGFDFGEVS